MPFNIRNWLIFSAFLTILIVAFTVLLDRLEYSSFLRYVKSEAVSKMEHVDWVIDSRKEINNIEELHSVLSSMGKNLNFRISYLDKEGRILADSVLDRQELARENPRISGKEISVSPQQTYNLRVRYSENLQKRSVEIAKQADIQLADAKAGFLYISIPVPDKFSALSSYQWVYMFAFILAGITATWILTNFSAKPIKNALYTLRKSTEDFAQGHLEERASLVQLKDFSPLIRSMNKMAKNLQNRLQYIEAQKQESWAIINGMYEGLIVLDHNGKVKLVNSRIKEDFAISDQIQGKKPIELIRSPELQDICNDMLLNRDKKNVSSEIELPGRKYFHISISRLGFESGDPEIIIVLHDISELKRLEKIRKDFVANVSHELRTPLTSIKGYAETLLSVDPEDRETISSFVQTIQKNADNIHDLLKDLIQLASLESGEDETELVSVDPCSAFQAAREICSPLMEEKNINLLSMFPEKDLSVQSNHKHLVQVFTNLLENAIKYSYENERIVVGVLEKKRELVFYVQDNGPGVPSQLRERIFERFFREEGITSARDGSGTGLGLSICKHIVNSHGGNIWVESPIPGEIQGSIFYFTLSRVN